jgi:hypothetical protein
MKEDNLRDEQGLVINRVHSKASSVKSLLSDSFTKKESKF